MGVVGGTVKGSPAGHRKRECKSREDEMETLGGPRWSNREKRGHRILDVSYLLQ